MNINVLLSQLDPGGDINARTTGRTDDIASLYNSIAQLGLLQPLLVRQEGERYRVVDGNRRLDALSRLAAAGTLSGDQLFIPVLVLDADDADAHTRSLAANIERLPMHEVDQYEAFARLEADGKEVADIARLFGISERRVQQRLALGKMPKEIRQAYREGQLRGEQLKVIANADPKLVKKAWKDGLRGWQLSDALQPKHGSSIRKDSALAQFIGRDRYVAEGGTFHRDLFVDAEDETWANVELAQLIAAKVAEEKCEAFIAEGWSFAHRSNQSWTEQAEYGAGAVDKKKITDPEDFKDWKRLKKEIDGLFVEWKAEKDEAAAEKLSERIRDLENEKEEIESEYDAAAFTDEQKARLGVVITPNYHVVYGVAPEGVPAHEDVRATEGDQGPTPPAEPEGPGPIANSLMSVLEMHLTHATMSAVQVDPRFALILLLDHLHEQKSKLGYVERKLTMHYDDYRGVGMEIAQPGVERVQEVIKAAGIAKAKTFEGRIRAWQKLEDSEIDKCLAYFIAQSLPNQQPKKDIVQLMDKAGYLDIKETWRPTVEDFFMKLTKPQLLALAEKHEIDVLATMKKGELAEVVRANLDEDWLPDEILP